MRASGDGGALRAGYQEAARLGAWEITRGPAAFTCRARVVSRTDYWLAQRPLDLQLTLGAARWTWHAVEPVIDGDSVTVTLLAQPDAIDRG